MYCIASQPLFHVSATLQIERSLHSTLWINIIFIQCSFQMSAPLGPHRCHSDLSHPQARGGSWGACRAEANSLGGARCATKKQPCHFSLPPFALLRHTHLQPVCVFTVPIGSLRSSVNNPVLLWALIPWAVSVYVPKGFA